MCVQFFQIVSQNSCRVKKDLDCINVLVCGKEGILWYKRLSNLENINYKECNLFRSKNYLKIMQYNNIEP